MTTFVNRYFSIGKESTFGTGVAADAYGEVNDESLMENFDILTRPDITRYGANKATETKHYSSGSCTLPVQPDFFFMRCLHAVYGTHTPSGTPGTGDTLTEVGTLPSLTVKIGRDDNEHEYTGQVVDSVSVSASIGEYAMSTVNWTGKGQETTLNSLGSPSYDYTNDAAHFAGCYVNFEDPATTSLFSKLVQSIDFEIRTNRDLDNSYALGNTTCQRAPPMQLREITGSVTFHKAVLSGDVADDEPHYTELLQGHLHNGSASNPAISILLQVDGNDNIRFDFHKVHYGVPETGVSGRDSQTMTVPFTVLYDETEGEMSRVTFSSTSTKLSGGGATDMDA